MSAPRGIDHLVLPVHDLGEARATYARLGFTCTPDAFHPFGTKNFLVQLQGSFLEVLAVHERGLYPPQGPDDFSFPRFNDGFLARNGEGFSMLVMDSGDPGADRTAFLDARVKVHAPFSFGRDAVLPDGSTARVGFDLTFVSDSGLPECGFFTCRQQHPPELFWKADYQRHANTAQSVRSVVLAGENWRDHFAFLAGFLGVEPAVARDHARFGTARGDVIVGEPAFADVLFGHRIAGEAMRLVGYEVGVADIAAAADLLAHNSVAHVRSGEGRLCVDPATSHGVAIAFAA